MWMMLALAALQVQQTAPTSLKLREARVAPQEAVAPQLRERQLRQRGDAQKLLAQAQAVQAGYVPKPGQPSKQELDAAIRTAKDDLDSMSDLSETTAMRIQMAMDRRSKAMSTLSNLLKRISDTNATVTQNLK